MAQIFPRNFAGNISLGDVSVQLADYSSGTLREEYGELENDSSHIIAAGAFRIEVHNTGLDNITVNYQGNNHTIGPNGKWIRQSKEDAVSRTRYYLDTATVTVPNGPSEENSATYSVEKI